MQIPILETERLTLKPVSLADIPAIQRHFNNWAIIQHLSLIVPWPYPDDGALIFVRDICLPAMEKGTAMIWALFLKGETEAIGLLDYQRNPELTSNRGFWLAEPYQGQGLMTEAVTAFQDYIFLELGVDQIHVVNAINNPRSARVKEKTGAVLVGESQLKHHHGESRCQRWLITQDRWRALRQS